MTLAAEMTDVEIEEPAQRAVVRHPSDLWRLLVALVVTFLGFFLATQWRTIADAITIEVIDLIDGAPNAVVVVTIIAVALFAVLLPILVIGWLVWRKLYRRLALGLLSAVTAMAATWLIREVVERFSDPDLPFTPPGWLCEANTTSDAFLSCVPGAFGNTAELFYLVAVVAFFATLAPSLDRRWHRFGWLIIIVFAFVRMITALRPATGTFLAIGLAYAVGASVVLVIGEPDRRPRGADVVAALSRSGIELRWLKRAGVDARGSTPWFAEDLDGNAYFVKVLSPEERAADNLFRTMRIFRLKGVGDERPFSTLKRGVEHEAVTSLKASSDGVRTPRMEAVVEVPPTSMLLAYHRIDGSSLDSVPEEELSDDVLRGVWQQLGILRERRTAHRDLRLANVFLADDQAPWLIDFGFSELAATDGQLRSDIAELTMSTATVIGAERAVSNAIAGIGAEAVADASSRIQPLALSGATRSALKQQKGLGDEVRNQIEEQTGIEAVELEDLERVKSRTVLMVLGFALAIYFLIPQVAQTDFGAIFDADWRFIPAILIGSFVSYVGAAFNVMGSVPDPIRLTSATMTQFAGTFVNRIAPVKVGGLATTVRALQKQGVDPSVAVAGVGVSTVASFSVHMSLLVIFVVFLGRNAGDFISLPSGNAVLVGLVVIFTIAGLVAFLPLGRDLFKKRVWPVIRRAGSGILQVAHRPTKAAMLFGGAFLSIMGYIAALWFSLEAFGGGLGFIAVGVVFLAGQALGSAAPTPGGIGATEAAMIAGMTALGLAASVAVPTVFLYRIATFWLPILPGFFALRKLEADGLL